MIQDENIYDKLKKFLPRGSIQRIADAYGVHRVHVSRVARGIYTNSKILEALLKKAEENKKRMDDISKRAKSL